MSITAELKQLRQQVEKLQVEVNGRQSINSRIIWDQQNEPSVNPEISRNKELQVIPVDRVAGLGNVPYVKTPPLLTG